MEVVLKDIRKRFGQVRANDGISLTLPPGRIYGLLGENGAGKSTLMKILSGYYRPDSGSIELDGKPCSFDSPADALENGIGMIYQDPLDVPTMRVVENYLLGRGSGVGIDYTSASKEILESASQMGYRVDPHAYIDMLSLGERQQLELLRLLSLGAQVLILDEPTTGISAEQKESLFASIRKLAREEAKTVIFVSHKLPEVQELCDHVLVLRKGKLVGEASIPCSNDLLVQMMFEEVPPRSEHVSFIRQEAILELKGVTIKSERLAVEGISLSVHAGEVFGLAGLEGSGQQLLLQACAGLIHPSRGKILLDGMDVSRKSYHHIRAGGVAYLTAGRLEEGLIAGLSLMEHIVLALPQKGFMIDGSFFEKETQRRIDRYQIIGRPRGLVDELSGGNQQRALFALLDSPLKLLLLEHPTRGLDVRSAQWIWQLLFERVSEGTAILFMSADLDELVERSDRIVAFSGGTMSRIVDANEATVDELGHMIGGMG
jgi:ABC-type uncharacterized transport system ATPase subunit